MANTLYDTIRLDSNLAGQLPVNEYSVSQLGFSQINYLPIVTRRGLTGHLHIHRTVGGPGNVPINLRDFHYELILTRAEYDALRVVVGTIAYFMPHFRDEGDPTSTRKVVVIQSMSEASVFNPDLADWWHAIVNLVDAENNTVDV